MYKKFLLGIALVLIIALGVFLIVKNEKSISTGEQLRLATVTSPTEDSVKTLSDDEFKTIMDTSKWKTYTNEDIGKDGIYCLTPNPIAVIRGSDS